MTAFTLLISPGMRGGSSRSVSRWTAHWIETGISDWDISGHHPEQEREQGQQDVQQIEMNLPALENPKEGCAHRKELEGRVSSPVQDGVWHMAFEGPVRGETPRHFTALSLGPEHPA